MKQRKIKILHVNSYIFGHVSFYHNFIEGWKSRPNIECQGLRLIDASPFFKVCSKILYFTLVHWRLPYLKKNGFDFYILRSELVSSFIFNLILKVAIRRYKPDVLHVHTQAISYLSTSIFNKIPTILSIDATWAAVSKSRGSKTQLPYKPIMNFEKRSFDAVDCIIPWSKWAKESVINDYNISPEKVVKLGCPASFSFSKEKEKLAHSGVNILFVGNDFHRKGGLQLLESFKRCINTSKSSSITLHIVSKNCDLEETEIIKVYKNILPNSDDLSLLYRNADFFVLPSLEDVSPVVFIEAMHFGLPLIGSNVMAIPEFVDNNVNGFLVRPNDIFDLSSKMSLLINSKQLRDSMGRRSLEKFLQSHSIDNYFNVLEGVINTLLV